MSKNIEKQYLKLLKDILDNGVEKQDRTGTGTISVFGRQIRHDMKTGFPLLTTKKMYWKGIVTELLWFLHGDTNIKYLVDNDCHIWDGDCYANYRKKISEVDSNGNIIHLKYPEKPLVQEEFINKIKTDDEFAEEWGELGPVYGKQWRSWTKKKMYLSTDGSYENIYDEMDQTVIDQISCLINDIKTNPDSRRLMVSAWNPSDLHDMVLPPCHYGFQVYTRELSLEEIINQMRELNKGITKNGREMDDDELRDMFKAPLFKEKIINTLNIPTRAISLMYNARSQDVPLGTPFNIASYALLLEIIGRMVNMVPDELISNMGDCHIYKDQIDGVKEQLTREPYPLPKLVISDDVNFNGTIDDFLNSCSISDLKIEGYQSHPPIKIPLSN